MDGTVTPRVELQALYPRALTAELLPLARQHGTYRQCSLGWHNECSQIADGDRAECRCLCHDSAFHIWSVEGLDAEASGGTISMTRVELGEHSWPPQPGEPEGMWAEWVYASSADDARERATAKHRARSA